MDSSGQTAVLDPRKLIVAYLRYEDTFVKLDGRWMFAERNLYVD